MKKLIPAILITILMLTACSRRPPGTADTSAPTGAIPADAPARSDAVPQAGEPEVVGPGANSIAEPVSKVAVAGCGISSRKEGAKNMEVYIDFKNNTGTEITQIVFDFEAYDAEGSLLLIGQDNKNEGGVVISEGGNLRVQIPLPVELSVVRLTVTKYVTAQGEQREIPKDEIVPESLDFSSISVQAN